MSAMNGLNQMEREAVYLMREIEAEKREIPLLVEPSGESECIKRLLRGAFFPEKLNPVYFEGISSGEIEYCGLRPSGQERTLLFDAKKDMLVQRPQMWHLYNGETTGEQQMILRPGMGFIDRTSHDMPMYKIITCGGVDDGKSTLIGRLLYDSATDDGKERFKEDKNVLRTDGSIDYAMLSACTREEAEQGITVSASYSLFHTKSRYFLMVDTPGHEEYTKNMANGASGAQAAIIMIAADKGIVPQTRRHTRICSFMGIRRFIFAVNKMDLMNYDSQVFMQICSEVLDMMQEYKDCVIKMIPVAAKKGENIGQRAAFLSWYTGETLLEALENVSMEMEEEEKNTPILFVQRICKSSQMEEHVVKKRMIQGELAEGCIVEGDLVTVYPTMEQATVRNIYVMAENRKSAKKGDPVSFELDRELDISRGYLLAGSGDIVMEDYIGAEILWVSDVRLKPGNRYLMKIGTKRVMVSLIKICYQSDVNTGEHTRVEYLTKNTMAECELSIQEKIPLACESEFSVLGKFILIDMETCETAGIGNITRCGIREEWEQGAEKVTSSQREKFLGQKAYILVFPEEEDVKGMMNRMEQRLMHMGYHTMQLENERSNESLNALHILFEAGLIVLLSAKKDLREKIMNDKAFENRRMIFDNIKDNREDFNQKLRSIRGRIEN